MGVKTGDMHLDILLLADDRVVLVEDENKRNYMVRKLIADDSIWGL